MAKQLLFDEEARHALKRGIEAAVAAVSESSTTGDWVPSVAARLLM